MLFRPRSWRYRPGRGPPPPVAQAHRNCSACYIDRTSLVLDGLGAVVQVVDEGLHEPGVDLDESHDLDSLPDPNSTVCAARGSRPVRGRMIIGGLQGPQRLYSHVIRIAGTHPHSGQGALNAHIGPSRALRPFGFGWPEGSGSRARCRQQWRHCYWMCAGLRRCRQAEWSIFARQPSPGISGVEPPLRFDGDAPRTGRAGCPEGGDGCSSLEV